MSSIEWLVSENCNFSCSYCASWDNTKQPEQDLTKLKTFLVKIKTLQQQQHLEFFIFGGEPFLHPKIENIVSMLNTFNIDYRFQTNLSKQGTEKIIDLKSKDIKIKKINISVHLSQQSVDDYIINIDKLLNNNIHIDLIEVMYYNKEIIDDYKKLQQKYQNVILTPVSDFLVEGFGNILKEYNNLREIDTTITFENLKLKHPITNKQVYRSLIWQEFIDKQWSPKGMECLLKDKFFMFDSQLDTFNCCFRDFIEDGICTYDTCFLS